MKWEYFIARTGYGQYDDIRRLNEMGEDGWELVSVIEHPSSSFTEFFFKRPKQS